MVEDFRSARFWAQELLETALFPGARAIDATMGNGHDTLWLCQRVGDGGHVYAFDVQPAALESTGARLREAGMEARATLICAGHEHMAEHVREPVDAVMFNLGWLPGAAHGVTTRTETTLRAAQAALELLTPGGLMTLCVYPGHDEGARELEALLRWASGLDEKRFDAMLRCYMNQCNHPPQMIAVKKKRGRKP